MNTENGNGLAYRLKFNNKPIEKQLTEKQRYINFISSKNLNKEFSKYCEKNKLF